MGWLKDAAAPTLSVFRPCRFQPGRADVAIRCNNTDRMIAAIAHIDGVPMNSEPVGPIELSNLPVAVSCPG